jgi:hypothetical protein
MGGQSEFRSVRSITAVSAPRGTAGCSNSFSMTPWFQHEIITRGMQPNAISLMLKEAGTTAHGYTTNGKGARVKIRGGSAMAHRR